MSDIVSSVSLYLTEGSSDKEYHAQLRRSPDAEDLYVVDFQYGRRGKPLRSGTKTKNPVEFEVAKKAYDKVVAEKHKGGYTPDVSGAIFQNAVVGEDFLGFLPQLPQTIRDEDRINEMIDDASWLMQEKYDGENRQVRVDETGQVLGINKRGLKVALPQDLADAFSELPENSLVSGEIMGNTLYVFDIQELGGEDLRSLPYSKRATILDDLVKKMDVSGHSDSVRMVETISNPQRKRQMCDEIRSGAREGVVFKRFDAPFSSGKAATTLSDQFKWKFTEDCTVRVNQASPTKRSVEVEIDGPDGQVLPLGKVSIPPNHDVPSPGDLVSVEYLHLFEGGSLFQAQYKGVRTDCEGPDALEQFKIKGKHPSPVSAKMIV